MPKGQITKKRLKELIEFMDEVINIVKLGESTSFTSKAKEVKDQLNELLETGKITVNPFSVGDKIEFKTTGRIDQIDSDGNLLLCSFATASSFWVHKDKIKLVDS